MKYIRRLFWFLARKLLLVSVVFSALVLTFYIAMNAANIYILLDDGMEMRANAILTREDAQELTPEQMAAYEKMITKALTLVTQEELLGYVLRERELEFLGEGKIWYDMLRMGRRDGGRYRQSLLIDPVVTFNESAGESWLRSVLISDDACFLPIVATDVERNPNLVQNPYYN